MSIPEFYRQFAPTSTAETFEERKRRKEQEELVEMQSTISVPETTIETPKTQEANIPEFYRQFSPTPKETIVQEKQESTIPEFYRQFKQKKSTDPTTLPAPVKYDRAYSLDDLDNDEYFQKRANRFLESIGTDEDIYETLRDSDWSITDALARAYDSGKWTEQQKADYKYLRNTFDKAEVGGLGHILEATKDIAIDIVADPLNLIAGLFIVGSGGAGVAGATAVSRIAASQAIKTGAKKLANQKGFRAVSMGLTEGAYDAGLINVGTQLTEIQTGVRQAGTEFSMAEAGVSAGLGATAGATLVGGAHKLANYMLRKEHDKLVKTYDLDDQLKNEAGEISSEAVSEFKSNVKFMDKITSQTVGKPLTEFIEDAKNSDIMKQLLLNFRHDTFRRIFSARSEKIDVANMTFSRDAEKTSNTYAVFVKKALQKLEYGKEGDTFLRRFFNPNLKLTEENDLAIWSLLARGNTLDKYMTVTPVDINKPLHSVNTKTLQPIHSPTQASGIPKGNRLSKEEFQFLRQYNVNQLEAAAKIRYFLKQAHKEASAIEAVDPKSGKLITESPVYEGGKIAQISLESIKESNPDRYSRIYNQKKAEDPSKTRKEIDQTNIEKVVPFSLFKTGQELDNYLPRKYIGKVMKEKEDIFVPALAKTSHALPKSQPKIEEKVLVDSVQNHIGTAGRERKYLPDPSTGEKVKVYKNEITEDQEYFFNFKTKNLPHIKERVARGENIDDIDAEFIFKRYDSFEDMAIAEINNTIEGTLDLNKLTAEQWDKITEIASGYKAKAVFDEFLKKETDPVYRKTLNDFYAENKIGKTEFLNPRIWNELDDKFLIDNGFIQTDAAAILEDYAWKLGHKINEEKYFGYGSNYVFRYLEPIREELIEKGYEPVKAKELTEKLLKARDYATGGRYANTDLSDLQKGLYDGIKVSQILAHLPFATLSSITEPLIALGRSDLADTPAFVKEFSKGIGKSTKKSAQRFYNHMQAARGKEVKGFKDLSDEDWLDAYRAGVATEQAMMTKIEGMFAEGMQTGRAKNIINAFFNINFLQQWTQGVQLGAFNYAKERSIRILGELAEDKNVYGIQLTTNSRSRRANQLREIGIDPKQGVAAYRRAIDEDGVFNKEAFKEDPFYDTEFTAAATLFSKEIILNPSAAELNKPMWFNSPGAGILVQFAGYPTAFNNTVLKGFARDVIRHPMANAPKVIAASGMMAGTATLMNWLRSGGESLKNRKDTEIILQSFERPGLLGWLQYPLRYYEGTQYGAGFIGSSLKSVSGPFVGDVVDGIAYRQPWFLALGTNLPGYGALSPQAKRDFKDMLRRTFDKKESDPRLRRAKGGEVIGVPNVKEEPDEAKMRGLPYTYSDLAGPLFQDEEERGAFAEGGDLKSTEKKLPPDAYRQDGSVKSMRGFLGPIKNELTGKIHTELSTNFDEVLDGREIPLLVPTLTQEEIDWFRKNNAEGNVKIVPQSIKQKAIRHAIIRDKQRLNPFYQDGEEENSYREDFAEGGKASIKETDEAYVYITKDEDAYNVQLNKNPIDVYAEEELPKLEVKDTYYTGFKGNTVSDRLNSVRQSSTIGLPVTKDKTKARGGVKASGKIKFKNVLKLDIDSVTPDSVQAEINKNIDSIIKIEDKVLAKEIVKATNDNLAIRDDIFNNDPNKTPEKKRVVERSKSFLVRQQLLKLSYDALETKEGYTLLRENQFLPTEIMESKNRLTGRLNYRYGKKVKPIEEVSDISPREFFEREQENWESDHGSIPVPTNDAGEQHLPIEERTKDIGFGHKITSKEMKAGLIHGIPFINKETGEFIDLTIEDKRFIKKQDNLTLVARARAEGWDKKLQERGLSWETIPDKYKLPLEDIAFNVKNPQQWNDIFDEIKNDNVTGFVKELRRKNAGQNTAGMDNRAAKAAAASGLITSYQQALDYGLELTTERRLPFLSKIFERKQYGLGGYMIDWFNQQMDSERNKLNRSTKDLDLDTAGVRENKLAKKVRRPIESDIKAAKDMINTESKADIIHRGGILGRDAIDLNRVDILSDPKNKYLRGFYNREKTQSRIRNYSKMFEDSGKSYEDSKEDYVYIVGQKNANPYVLSHEFRHRAFSPKEMSENTNRLYDAFYARNQKELNQVLNDMLPKKREAFLKRLDKYAPLIIGREVLQLREEHIELLKKLKEKNIPFPKRIDWDLERKRLIEQYNFRAKNTTRKQLGLGGFVSALNRRQQYGLGGRIASKLRRRS